MFANLEVNVKCDNATLWWKDHMRRQTRDPLKNSKLIVINITTPVTEKPSQRVVKFGGTVAT